MGVTLLSVGVLLVVISLRIGLELHLKKHHLEVHRSLVVEGRQGNLLIAHMNNQKLLGFLFRRRFAGLGDRRLTLLCNAMLGIIVAFLMMIFGGLVGLLVTYLAR